MESIGVEFAHVEQKRRGASVHDLNVTDCIDVAIDDSAVGNWLASIALRIEGVFCRAACVDMDLTTAWV